MDISLGATLLTILVSVWGIVYEVEKNRKLSRKNIAIDLLNDNIGNAQWLKSLRLLTDIKIDNKDYDWKDFAVRKFTPGKTLAGDEKEISEAIRTVLNYFEFLSIAMLSEAANEEIIKANLGCLFILIHDELKEYIAQARICNKDDSIYINYTAIVDKWKSNAEAMKPVE